MKIQHKIIGASIIAGVFIWIIDAVLDFLFFHEATFFEVLIFHIPPHHLYIRLVGIGSFLIFGIIIAKVMSLRKRAEDDLKYAHSDLNQVFNAAVPLCVIAKNFEMHKVNNTFCKFFDVKREEVLGKKCYEIWEDKVCDTVECPLRKIIGGLEEYEGEVEKKLSNGKTFSCIVTAIPYRSPNGKLLGVVENFTDITERKKAERELEKYRSHLEVLVNERTDELQGEIAERKQIEKSLIASQARLQQLLTSSPTVIYSCKPSSDFEATFVSENIKMQLGYEPQEFLNDSQFWANHIQPEERPSIFNKLNHLEKNDYFFLEYRFQHKDGTYRWIHDELGAVKDAKGNTFELVGSMIDITERKQAEEALRESEAKYRNLRDKASDAILLTSEEGYLLEVNRKAETLLGYTKEELIGMDIHKLHPKGEVEKVINDFKRVFEKGEASTFDAVFLRKDGKTVSVDITGSVFEYGGKRVSQAIVRDITERKKMEEELQKIEKLESLGVLAGGIAHDFNNLLTAIIGNLSLVELYAKSGNSIFEVLDETKRASQQTKYLTQQLLTFARGGEPIRENVSLPKFFQDTVILALSGSNVKGKFSIPDTLWWAEIDKGQINQVISNIIINATQAMPRGGIIEVRAENLIVTEEDSLPLKDGKYIKFSVKDGGIGIRVEELNKIFDPYFTTKQKGSGLGLAITHSIIKKHDGYIAVKSQLGTGTTFSIYLPASEKEFFMVKDVIEEKPLSGKGRVLFMDDQPSLRNMIGKMLNHLGYEVEFAKDGSEAIELYKKAKNDGQMFDAVILDLTVPAGMGGKEAIERLVEIDTEIKAIVSSGYANDPIISEYERYGFSGFVTKPYEIKELSEVLFKIINSKTEHSIKG